MIFTDIQMPVMNVCIINALVNLSEKGMNTDVLGVSFANGKFCTLSRDTLAAGFLSMTNPADLN